MIDPRIANKEVVVFIRANAVTRSDQASMAALCVAAFPVLAALDRGAGLCGASWYDGAPGGESTRLRIGQGETAVTDGS
jgi:hypothetical protein